MTRKTIPYFFLLLLACGGNVEADGPSSSGGAGGTDAGADVGTDAAGGTGSKGGTGGTGATGGTGGTNTGGGTGGAAGSIAECPDAGGPTMVLLPEGYCIDSTEVTRGQYAAWLDTNPSIVGQPSRCKWNNHLEPQEICEEKYRANGQLCASDECQDAPQSCVDWCDAFAYCKAMGKRLCGHIGGGDVDFDDFDDPTKSQWQNACSSGGLHEFPYGDQYEPTACNTEQTSGMDVGSLTTCQSSVDGYGGVYDLSGNALEWEDACEYYTDPEGPSDGSGDWCRLRGGSGSQSGDDVACTSVLVNVRAGLGGIRCCYP